MKTKITLSDDEIPRQWYNIAADQPTPMDPPLHPGTGQPVGPEDLAPIFPMSLIEQEVSQERVILFNWSGQGLMDLVGYDKYFQGELTDYALPDEDLEKFAASMAEFPTPGSVAS